MMTKEMLELYSEADNMRLALAHLSKLPAYNSIMEAIRLIETELAKADERITELRNNREVQS